MLPLTLLDLPLEMRQRIYLFALDEGVIYHQAQQWLTNIYPRFPRILLVCKQMFFEAALLIGEIIRLNLPDGATLRSFQGRLPKWYLDHVTQLQLMDGRSAFRISLNDFPALQTVKIFGPSLGTTRVECSCYYGNSEATMQYLSSWLCGEAQRLWKGSMSKRQRVVIEDEGRYYDVILRASYWITSPYEPRRVHRVCSSA